MYVHAGARTPGRVYYYDTHVTSAWHKPQPIFHGPDERCWSRECIICAVYLMCVLLTGVCAVHAHTSTHLHTCYERVEIN